MHIGKVHNTTIVLLMCMAVAVIMTGCSSDAPGADNVEKESKDISLLVKGPTSSNAKAYVIPDTLSTKENILEYLRTLNGEFEPGNKIRVVNNALGKVPNFSQKKVGVEVNGNNGYFEYECVPVDTTSDGFYRFKPTDTTHKLTWKGNDAPTKNTIFTNGSYYAFNALYYLVYDDKGSSGFDNITVGTNAVYSFVRDDQSDEVKFRSCDIMQAHHLKDVNMGYGQVIKLQFWHQLAMVVINVNVPMRTALADGFTPEQMYGSTCTMTGFYRYFLLPYNLDLASDSCMATDLDKTYEMDNVLMWSVGKVRVEKGKDGSDQLARTFVALIPNQTKNEGTTGQSSNRFCQFVINGKKYGYKPKGNVELLQSRITVINLLVNPEQNDPILIGSQILPWHRAYVPDFPLYPIDN